MVDTCFQGHRSYLYTLLMKIHQELMDALLEDCILASRALGDQVELLCKVLPSWPLLFQQKECYASCIWTSSGIQCAGSLIAHYQLLSHTDFSFAPRNWVILLSCES